MGRRKAPFLLQNFGPPPGGGERRGALPVSTCRCECMPIHIIFSYVHRQPWYTYIYAIASRSASKQATALRGLAKRFTRKEQKTQRTPKTSPTHKPKNEPTKQRTNERPILFSCFFVFSFPSCDLLTNADISMGFRRSSTLTCIVCKFCPSLC